GNQSIGRKSLNAKSELQIQTNDTTMSRSHCQIIGQKSKNGASLEFVLKDYNSTNKVYLNGVQLGPGQEAYLSHGDHIKIGNSLLLFEYV
ncbi:MAG: FHA domain-containing protein, partial [Saprospiraceae bacterium]|nr:FHA domain-containing protein [Saprospiraceae bacterium]